MGPVGPTQGTARPSTRESLAAMVCAPEAGREPTSSDWIKKVVTMDGRIPADVEQSLDDVLEPGEGVLGSVTTLAGTLVLTDRHVVIVREGRGYRPATGVRSWAISTANALTYGPLRGGVGRLMVGSGSRATSFFVKGRDWDDALRIVTKAHQIAYLGATKGW